MMFTLRGQMPRLVVVVLTVLVALALPLVAAAAPPVPGGGESSTGTVPETRPDYTKPESGLVAAPSSLGSPTTVVAKEGLWLREGPMLSDPTVLCLANGETVYPSAGPMWNQGIEWVWVIVYRHGVSYQGFCAAAHLANYGGYAPTSESGLKVVAPWGLRLRTCPGKACKVGRIVPYGTVLATTGTVQWAGGIQWSEVYIDGVTMWAATSYMQAV